MLKDATIPGHLIFFDVVGGTPRTILDPPRHFSGHKKYRKYLRPKLLLRTSNDPPDTFQMVLRNYGNLLDNLGSESCARPLGYGR